MLCRLGLPAALLLTLSLAMLASSSSQSPAAAPVATGFLYKTLELDKGDHAYCVFVPPNYTADKPWPVILFLHGSGECGEDGLLQTDVGIGRALRRNWRRIPAIVVMPQCPRDAQRAGWGENIARLALRCVEETSREYHLDPDRVYLTGLSLGGAGAWRIAAQMPEKFAALVPICGFGDPADAPKLARLPIWVFHGAQDDRVRAAESRKMVNAVRGAGGTVEYTEYADGKHNVWDRAYDDRELWKWLFAQKRAAP